MLSQAPVVAKKDVFTYVITCHGGLENAGVIRLKDYRATVVSTVPIGESDTWSNGNNQIDKIRNGIPLEGVYSTSDAIPECAL